jgi:dTDP-4-dehydrorhamnose 3,5-epimerase
MKFSETPIRGAWLVEPEPKGDSRGWFMRVWCQQEFEDHGIDFTPIQANMAHSIRRGTLRGLHFQVAPAPEAKLVRCTRGSLFDVVVDLREHSPTYRAWHGVQLSAQDGRMLYLPEGCAHGCQALEDTTELHYLTSARFSPGHARGVRYDDPLIGVHWPLPVTEVSQQDRSWPLLQLAEK